MMRFVVLVCALVASAAASPLNSMASPFNPRGTVIQNAKLGQFPYQISLTKKGYLNCGGSILNNRWILTAASCVNYWPITDYQVTLGTIQLDDPSARVYNLSKIVVHELFDNFVMVNNIALVRVNEDIEFNDNVQPIALETENIGGNVPVNITFWAGNLRWVTLPTLTVDECQEQHYAAIYPTQICTVAACQGGDHGSPIVKDGKVCGVMSWTLPCARLLPEVYTRVSKYVDWINAKINN